MRTTIPDALGDIYQSIATRQGRSVDEVITAQLDRFQHCAPGERAIALDVTKLEAVLGGLPIRDGADVMRRLQDLRAITFHGIALDFTPGQLEELQRRADREGKDVEALAKEIVEQLQRQFFWGTEPASAVR